MFTKNFLAIFQLLSTNL